MTHSDVLQRIADTGECFLTYGEAQELFKNHGSLGMLWRDRMRGFAQTYQLDHAFTTVSDRLQSLVRTNGFMFRPLVDSALDYAKLAAERRAPGGLPNECKHFIVGPCDLCESEGRIESHIALAKADYDQLVRADEESRFPVQLHHQPHVNEFLPGKDAFDLQADLITDTLDTMDQVLTADPQATEVAFEGKPSQRVALYAIGDALAQAGFPKAGYPSVIEQLDAAIEELHQLRSDKAAAEERAEGE